MNYTKFLNDLEVSKKDICREIYNGNRKSIRTKKEKTFVKNLERIFDATLKISNEIGFSSMTLRQLSKESGISLGGLYANFKSKDNLLEMLQRHRRTVIIRILEKTLASYKNVEEKLEIAIKTHLYLAEAMQPWFFFTYMEARNLPKPVKKEALLGDIYTENIYIDIFKEGYRQNIFCQTDFQLLASMIKAMHADWYLKRWKYAKRKITVDEYAQFVFNCCRTILKTAPDDLPQS